MYYLSDINQAWSCSCYKKPVSIALLLDRLGEHLGGQITLFYVKLMTLF